MMKKVSCIAIISIVIAMSGCAVDAEDDQEGSDDSLSETESAVWWQCPYGYVCAWSQPGYEGQLSYWPGGDTGCHYHTGNPYIRSGWNNTAHRYVSFGGFALAPGYAFGNSFVTAPICW